MPTTVHRERKLRRSRCGWLSACGVAGSGRLTARTAKQLAQWSAAAHIRRVLDLSASRQDGAVAIAAAGRLVLLPAAGAPRPFARATGGYTSPGGEEPYIVLTAGASLRRTFGADNLYALRLANGPGVTVIDRQGHARRFARLAGPGRESGIAFDQAGRFGHRLLVTATNGAKTSVYAIDARGRATRLTNNAPKVEGGIAVAPASFGRFGGDLIASDEYSGRIYAITPDGHSHLLANSGLPYGPDTGVESEGFVPARFGSGWSALLADRLTPGNRHPGDDVVLRLGAAALSAAGVRPGDLLVASEGGARTDAISCRSSCQVNYVANGPAVAHAEGHIVFRPAG
jgi:hypothetical protein